MGAPQKQKPRWASPRVVVGAFGAVFAVALLANYRSNSSGGAQGWSLSSAPAASAQSTAAPTTTLTDVEIHRRCAKYKVPEPPQYRPEKVAEAEAMVKLLRHKGGVYKLMGNKTFMKAMATFTLEERERMALEAHTVVLHLQKEALTLIAQEEVRPGAAGGHCRAQHLLAAAGSGSKAVQQLHGLPLGSPSPRRRRLSRQLGRCARPPCVPPGPPLRPPPCAACRRRLHCVPPPTATSTSSTASTWAWAAAWCTPRSSAWTHTAGGPRAREVSGTGGAVVPRGLGSTAPVTQRRAPPATSPLTARRAPRSRAPAGQVPAYQSTAGNTLLAWADQLPFRSNSIDYIVSLQVGGRGCRGAGQWVWAAWWRIAGDLAAHSPVPSPLPPPLPPTHLHPPHLQNMEHLHDPVATVLHYMDILKPGGGLGVGLPNWRYAWDARNEITAWGHRWNTAPEVVCYLYHKVRLRGLGGCLCGCSIAGQACVPGGGYSSGGHHVRGPLAAAPSLPPPGCPRSPVVLAAIPTRPTRAQYWSHVCDLEQLNTMTYRLTFDFVLRKKGKWEPFPQEFPTYPTGRELFCAGKFIGPPNMPPTVNNDTLGPCATPTPDVFI